jgi:hypothetical protein
MAITIKGVRITSITVSRTDEGSDRVSCNYELISSADKVLAKQSLSSVSSYNETMFVPPSDTLVELGKAVERYKRDVETHLGLI